MSSIGERIRELRAKRGLTQDQLGSLMGFKDPGRRIRKWESGSFKPSAANLFDLAKALGVSSDYLLGGEENERE